MKLIENILGMFPKTESDSIKEERREKVTRLIFEDRKTAREELKGELCSGTKNCGTSNMNEKGSCLICQTIDKVLGEK